MNGRLPAWHLAHTHFTVASQRLLCLQWGAFKAGFLQRACGLRVSVKANSAGLKLLFVTHKEDTQKTRSLCQSKYALEKLSDINTHAYMSVRAHVYIHPADTYADIYCKILCANVCV